MEKIKQQIAEKIKSLDSFAALEESEIIAALEPPADSKLGDLALPCFKFAKTLRKSPQAIAGELQSAFIDGSLSSVGKIEAVGGYLNFFVSPDYFSDVLHSILASGAEFGRSEEGAGKVVTIDYSSPNIAKKFHIGHLGTTLIGNSLKKLYEFTGHKVVGINYLGDWGTQFGKVIAAYKLWGNEKALEERGMDELVDLYVKFSKESEENKELHEMGKQEFRKLEQYDEENITLWKRFKEISLKEYAKTYELLGIEFDSYNGESFYNDKMQAVIEELKEKELLELDNGAYIVRLDEFKMPVVLILKSDGSTIYATRDLAAAIWRYNEYNFDKALYVTSAGQSLHFAQFFKVLELMGYDWAEKLEHVPYGTYSFGGEKIASRTGNVVLLNDLFDDAVKRALSIIEEKNPNLENKETVAKNVGVGAIIFGSLANSRIRDVNFNWEEALSFEGNTGPYVQYSYARTASVLRKSGEVSQTTEGSYSPDVNEIALIKTLSQFPVKVGQAIAGNEPSVIARYALEVCWAFNLFYHNNQILNAEGACRSFRLSLTKAANTVIGSAIDLLGMGRTEVI